MNSTQNSNRVFSSEELHLTKRVRVAIVGLNFGEYIAEKHIMSGPGQPYFELAGVCDIDHKKLKCLSQKWGCPAFGSLDDVLKDETIPAVILLTGPHGRAELLRKIIRAGKDVMTTKPFEMNSEEAASVLHEARDLQRFIYLNSPTPAETEDYRLIDHWRKKYALGRPLAAHHESWYKKVEQADGSWYDDSECCPVAPILRLGIYGINDMLRIMGEPECLQVMETRLFAGRSTPDLARMTIKFKNGALADTMAGWALQPERGEQSLILYFENGTIFRNPTMLPSDPLTRSLTGKTYLTLVTPDCDNGMPIEKQILDTQQLSLCYQWDVFYASITTRQRPQFETPDEVIVNSVSIIEAMKRASQSGATEIINAPS